MFRNATQDLRCAWVFSYGVSGQKWWALVNPVINVQIPNEWDISSPPELVNNSVSGGQITSCLLPDSSTKSETNKFYILIHSTLMCIH
jgi:hypothetical protein